MTMLPAAMHAGVINVPDGNFTQASGAGTVGGGILDLSGSQTIGSGPWTGTYTAVAGLLLPPQLTISTTGGEPSGGYGSITGIASGLNILTSNIVDSGGQFSQTLPVSYLANTTYTLSVNVDAGSVLGAGVLSLANGGVGIGLTNGGNDLADTTENGQIVSLSLLSGTNYNVVLDFTTGAVAPTGDIGVRLFDMPSGVAQANLLGGVAFSGVQLSELAQSSVPEPSSNMMVLLGGGLCGFAVMREKSRRKPEKEA
jgi:hypothetical protein